MSLEVLEHFLHAALFDFRSFDIEAGIFMLSGDHDIESRVSCCREIDRFFIFFVDDFFHLFSHASATGDNRDVFHF